MQIRNRVRCIYPAPARSRSFQWRPERGKVYKQSYLCKRHEKPSLRIVANASDVSETQDVISLKQVSMFDSISKGSERRYVMISGKGGVGKTTLAASLAAKLAAEGHTTLIVSTDPAHSLGDSLAQVRSSIFRQTSHFCYKDLSGGKPIAVEGTDLPLWGMEIDPEEAKAEFVKFSKSDKGTKMGENVKGMAEQAGLGAEDLAELKLEELLDSPPPGLDEAMALAKVIDFVSTEDYARFSRIVFDTAPTGHTLRMLRLPDFVGSSLAKIMKLRRTLKNLTDTISSAFGREKSDGSALDALQRLSERVEVVKLLFQNQNTTEFIIATIPTVLSINESRRLLTSLRQQKIPCNKMIVNQVQSIYKSV